MAVTEQKKISAPKSEILEVVVPLEVLSKLFTGRNCPRCKTGLLQAFEITNEKGKVTRLRISCYKCGLRINHSSGVLVRHR